MSQETREQMVLDAVASRRELVNEAIDEHLPMDDPERLYEAARSILEAGGKRLRPAMFLLVAEALGDVEPLSADYDDFPGPGDASIDVMAGAVGIEVIHSFTLIHDDIMDDDDVRRGQPAVHRAYDSETAILAGDTLYSKAFEILLRTDAPAARRIDTIEMLAETCTHICEGQAMDVGFEDRQDVLPDEYAKMIELKTAVLFAASAAIPTILLGGDAEQREALYRYGLCVGQAFQIQDDVLDLTVPSDKLGKQRGSDLVEGKRTLVTLHARDQGVDVEDLVEADDESAITEAEIDDAVATLEEAGSIDYARTTADELVEEGKSHLEVLPDNEARAQLAMLAEYLIERGY